jgi:hypothetical protein
MMAVSAMAKKQFVIGIGSRDVPQIQHLMHDGTTNHAADASDVGLEPLIERAFDDMKPFASEVSYATWVGSERPEPFQ